MNRFNTLLVTALTLMLAACASTEQGQRDPGGAYFERGQYDLAAEAWRPLAQESDPVAQHNLGVLSRHGLGSTPLQLDKAASLFLQSASQNYVPAMISLAEVQTEMGQVEAARSWLTLAARWGNEEAIAYLEESGLKVPRADLYSTALSEQQLQRMRAVGELIRPPIRKINADRVDDTGR